MDSPNRIILGLSQPLHGILLRLWLYIRIHSRFEFQVTAFKLCLTMAYNQKCAYFSLVEAYMLLLQGLRQEFEYVGVDFSFQRGPRRGRGVEAASIIVFESKVLKRYLVYHINIGCKVAQLCTRFGQVQTTVRCPV